MHRVESRELSVLSVLCSDLCFLAFLPVSQQPILLRHPFSLACSLPLLSLCAFSSPPLIKVARLPDGCDTCQQGTCYSAGNPASRRVFYCCSCISLNVFKYIIYCPWLREVKRKTSALFEIPVAHREGTSVCMCMHVCG